VGLTLGATGGVDLPGWVQVLATFATLGLVPGVAFDFRRWLSQLLVGQDIELGSDGIRWGKWRWRKFVPYADLESLEVERGSSQALSNHVLILQTRDGQEHRVSLRGFEPHAANVVEERLRGVLERSAEVLMPQLTREDQTDEEWREALRRLMSHEGGYRMAPVSKAKVKQLLEDPSAPMEQRLGAGAALVEAQDPEAHRILVRVSDATANPELRGPLVSLAKEAEEFVEADEDFEEELAGS